MQMTEFVMDTCLLKQGDACQYLCIPSLGRTANV